MSRPLGVFYSLLNYGVYSNHKRLFEDVAEPLPEEEIDEEVDRAVDDHKERRHRVESVERRRDGADRVDVLIQNDQDPENQLRRLADDEHQDDDDQHQGGVVLRLRRVSGAGRADVVTLNAHLPVQLSGSADGDDEARVHDAQRDERSEIEEHQMHGIPVDVVVVGVVEHRLIDDAGQRPIVAHLVRDQAAIQKARQRVQRAEHEHQHGERPPAGLVEDVLGLQRPADVDEPVHRDQDHHPDGDGLEHLQQRIDVELDPVVLADVVHQILHRIPEQRRQQIEGVRDGKDLEQEQRLAALLVLAQHDDGDDVSQNADDPDEADQVELDGDVKPSVVCQRRRVVRRSVDITRVVHRGHLLNTAMLT
ncbi:hypothetical protein LSH36_717g00000 [Paralvinella palmiformis]|uniref:Uncharacterized protein n=1 Tax=Paralvinella palmiformis TaxID=53620 RepID=A0AAD9MVW5_9ANNE|nr:hypothetical protein LSH36_717g00000 [Paralvinella palmiformis]